MTEEQVKRISEIYKLKSELLNDLSHLTSSDYSLDLCYHNVTTFSSWGPSSLVCSKLLSKEIKEIVLVKIQLEIDKIDLELANIKCT